MRRLNLILNILYPPAVHFALMTEQPSLALWLLIALSSTQLLSMLFSRSTGSLMVLVPIIVLGLCLYGLSQQSIIALYLPPVFISGFFLWLFARTLRSGHEPLITTLARHVFSENDPQILRYTRRVTQAWSLFFLGMLIECLLLAMFASVEFWSLFANLLNYLLIALMFVAEFTYRRLHFAQKMSIKEIVRRLHKSDWGAVFREKAS